MEREWISFFWPQPLWDSCHRLGPGLVYGIGMAVLQYPPLWCDSDVEFTVVNNAIQEYDNGTFNGFQ